jgi:hypothetical protein
MSRKPGQLICDRRSKDVELCGVFMGHSFCENPIYKGTNPARRYRRCEVHFAALKRDDLYESLRALDDEHFEKALSMLDDVQKHRPRWQYEGREAELIAAAQEQKS